jgi:hypothetical protein
MHNSTFAVFPATVSGCLQRLTGDLVSDKGRYVNPSGLMPRLAGVTVGPPPTRGFRGQLGRAAHPRRIEKEIGPWL